MKWLDAARVRLGLLFARRRAESRMDQEFRLHIDMETEQLIARGVAPGEARRQALVAFGGVEPHKEALREGRGLAWLDGFALDLKLAARLLARYPWLTLVGGTAIAFGIAAGVGTFELRTKIVNPTLPLDEGSRIVGLRIWDASSSRVTPSTPDDLTALRDGLSLVEDVSAFRMFSRNLLTSDGRSDAESVAAMSASGFRVARVTPIAGRTLIDSDEDPGAPPVVVIGHDVWKRRFASDPGVLGQTVRLGREQTTVVGIMPDGFTFPATPQLWIPLQRATKAVTPAEDSLLIFGRLAADASQAEAEAELAVIGRRRPEGWSTTRTNVQTAPALASAHPQLVPFTRLMFDSLDVRIGLAIGNIFVVMLLVLVCANVALLTFARAATRDIEIAVRTALGASRARIVTQLFLEGLVLAATAVAAGLAAARFTLRSLLALFEAGGRPLPFWMNGDLTASTMLYAGALTVVSAAIIGIFPALKITGGGQLTRLRQSSGGGGGARLGGVWTAVIAAQVATTVMFPAGAFFFHRWVVSSQSIDIGVAASNYLSARLELDQDGAPPGRTFTELERRVSTEAAVSGLTFADRLPGTGSVLWRIQIEGEESPEPPVFAHRVSSASVGLNFFEVFGAPILTGRNFTATDLDSAGVVIVNTSFVNRFFGGQNPLGRHIRRGPQDIGPWLEIIGVVQDLGMGTGDDAAGVYRPISLENAPSLRVAVAVTGRPESFAARLRTVARDVEPTLQIHELMTLDDVIAGGMREIAYMSRVMTGLSALALLLSLTAIYSVTDFAISRRTREIGIRVALGAERLRVIGPLLRRPLSQVGLGIVCGAILSFLASISIFESTPSLREAGLIAAYALLMMIICLLACVVPVRRALSVAPAEVLRADA
jgi:putative ABC transport system permease protein